MVFAVQRTCFTDEVTRLQSFRQHEFVFVDDSQRTLEDCGSWLNRARTLLEQLGLTVDVVVTNKPFLGRVGRNLASGQRERILKLEVVSPISLERPGAIALSNLHENDFGIAFPLALLGEQNALSASVGLELERVALALLFSNGLVVEEWPEGVRDRLQLELACDGVW